MTTRNRRQKANSRDANRDLHSGEPGAHPVGVGVGTALAGVAAGGVADGPVGAAVGAVIGGVAGGLAGKATAEEFDPTAEDAFWHENYARSEYYQKGREYSYYQPAYRFGWESRKLTPSQASFEDSEHRLRRHWLDRRGTSQLTWDEARPATRDAWNRVAFRSPGP